MDKIDFFGKCSIGKNDMFLIACENGHFYDAEWLYSLGNIDIHAKNEYAFRKSCQNGHLDVAKWLYFLGNIYIHANNDEAFRSSCKNKHIEVAIWLASICDEYFVVVDNNRIMEWKILDIIELYIKNKEFIKIIPIINIKKEQHNPLNIKCPVCYDKTLKLTIKIKCEHIFCIACINTIKNQNGSCPLCRKRLEYFSYDLHI